LISPGPPTNVYPALSLYPHICIQCLNIETESVRQMYVTARDASAILLIWRSDLCPLLLLLAANISDRMT
jgi:hypothetical protein